ncbi:IS66 family insertion sequence element accessory protein TnpA [Anaerophilus nitritogenes]|uniref:IS66 family insertion sequence element accessory protein TnpA n=1 Tax=Anaerophilus nitritogenes TaxID=2498136 RepID=UPI00101D6393|nr:hypothetical protein [Anaerophilus nitritogenes]
MNKDKNKEMWINRVNEYKASGLPQKAWYAKNDVKLGSFRYWVTKVFSNPSDNKEEFEFASVSISKEFSPAIAVEINGVTLSVICKS